MDRQVRNERRARRGPCHGRLRTGAAEPDCNPRYVFPPFAPLPPVARGSSQA